MANQHYSVDRELEINLKIKVKVTELSNYYHLSEEQINIVLDNLHEDFEREFKWRLEGLHRLEESSVDYVYYDVID